MKFLKWQPFGRWGEEFMQKISVAYRYRKSISIIELFLSIYINIYRFLGIANFSDPPGSISKFTGWAIIEELSKRRRVRTFLIR